MPLGKQYEIVEEWDEILSMIPENKRDIYYTKKYLSLYETAKNKALCVVCRENDSVMLMPYLRGEINESYDFETAYGYGGPIANTDDLEWCHDAYRGIHELLRNENYVCGFTRFHPLLSNKDLICNQLNEQNIQILYDRQTVAIDTTADEDEIWMKQISSKNRNMIRKAERNQLEYKAEYDFSSYKGFISLYRETMRRLSADDFYFFDDAYFYNLREQLNGCSFLGTVRKEGRLICAAIFLFTGWYGHYHLEGSDYNYSSLGANNYLLWKTACEMHRMGIREFHLGGGTSSSLEDSLYKFKRAFSGNEKKFFICKEIYDREKYLIICEEWEKHNPDKVSVYGNRLLKYRY